MLAGLIERPRRGWYRIAEAGRDVDKRGLAVYSEKDMLEWPAWAAYQQEIVARKRRVVAVDKTINSEMVDPFEMMAAGERELNAQTETILRKGLQSSSPYFFERAVIDLLWARGMAAHMARKNTLDVPETVESTALSAKRR